jgi:hypothetical protein
MAVKKTKPKPAHWNKRDPEKKAARKKSMAKRPRGMSLGGTKKARLARKRSAYK